MWSRRIHVLVDTLSYRENGKKIANVDFPREKLTIDPKMWEE